MPKAKRPTIEEAKRQYTNRYTMEHVPSWALKVRPDGTYYAPQYLTDAEWYDNVLFPGEDGHDGTKNHINARNQTWPLGQSLAQPYRPKVARRLN